MKKNKTKKMIAAILVSLFLIYANNAMAESGRMVYDPVNNCDVSIDMVSYINVKTNQTKKTMEFDEFGFSVKEKPAYKKVLVGKVKTGRTEQVMKMGTFGFTYSEEPVYDYIPLKRVETGLEESRWEFQTFGFGSTQKPVYRYIVKSDSDRKPHSLAVK
jgi:hypothetical protein